MKKRIYRKIYNKLDDSYMWKLVSDAPHTRTRISVDGKWVYAPKDTDKGGRVSVRINFVVRGVEYLAILSRYSSTGFAELGRKSFNKHLKKLNDDIAQIDAQIEESSRLQNNVHRQQDHIYTSESLLFQMIDY